MWVGRFQAILNGSTTFEGIGEPASELNSGSGSLISYNCFLHAIVNNSRGTRKSLLQHMHGSHRSEHRHEVPYWTITTLSTCVTAFAGAGAEASGGVLDPLFPTLPGAEAGLVADLER